jgi:hypothetical protein
VAIKTSPGGSAFPYYYKGAEIFGLHLGNFCKDEAGLLARMKAEEAFIADTYKHFPLWIDFYQTRLTDAILDEFLHGLQRVQGRITKLALYGVSRRDQRRIREAARQAGIEFPFPVRYFDEPETAKTWLVSEAAQQ